MKEAFEKIQERLRELENVFINGNSHNAAAVARKALSIVSEVEAEYEQQDHTDYANTELYAFWQKHQWVSVEERLPEENKEGWTHLLLSIKTGEVIFGLWHSEEMGFCKHFRDGICKAGGVLAWMPLPEPYKPID